MQANRHTYKLIKEYKFDDSFKKRARALQFAYREEILHDFNEYRAPQVLLSDENARNGLIFYEAYRNLIISKPKVGHAANQLTANMLRSEHIPYNMFTPLETMPMIAAEIFSLIIGTSIKKIEAIEIEYAGCDDKSQYLNDRTSFDTFIRYESADGRLGGIGIEVKYTENAYPLGAKEGRDIEGGNTRYREMTAKSGYYHPDLDIRMFLTAHHLRQIWRNHILGYSMEAKGDVDIMHHVHLYPRMNEHFHQYALPEYRKLLTDKGNDTFRTLTYEEYFSLLDKYSDDDNVRSWLNYLRKRYLGL